ncbi:hypothetical protein RND71_036350 [Anisodus tanguticus]|uniref:Uncharacterized protein n=1 Tax=Anisodus tanguticus TaxID=243964 RepID=A0AAE1UXQ7_9SOLA|nr:hypothetical protein RND71_036350 [Anisodus tanguticus]
MYPPIHSSQILRYNETSPKGMEVNIEDQYIVAAFINIIFNLSCLVSILNSPSFRGSEDSKGRNFSRWCCHGWFVAGLGESNRKVL